ncbi:shikimate kinase [Treponema putidum]|uniref:Shikimate kinase n=1 Tax=Treponema putidum TaxID=221027 RepID=A0AAE9MSM6_9SPIR|nr:shikimate kinase [Treponema putidum]UTY28054.1 shikimate kinase [Treponema putidum]UTY32960.1 shikimate kinase [Treponema putidum]
MIIFLVGMSRAGKTETGKILAKKLKASFIDTDAYMEEFYGKNIRELYQTFGEKIFRLKEFECFNKIIGKNAVICDDKNAVICGNKNAVISTGGGSADNILLIEKIKSHPNIVLIDTPPSEIFYRIKTAAHKEGFYPAFLGENIKNEKDAEKRFFSIYERRIKIYKALSSFSVNPKGLSPEKTADKIISSLVK